MYCSLDGIMIIASAKVSAILFICMWIPYGDHKSLPHVMAVFNDAISFMYLFWEQSIFINHLCAFIHSENQQFLKDVTAAILEGRGVGWLKLNRVKKLMEDENYRNFVVSRLNTSLEKKLSDESQHIEDVVCHKIKAT